MDRYHMDYKLGDGTFGTVWKAVDRKTGDAVAVKKMKRRFDSWGECLALREVVALRALRHPCIVRLREVVREHERLYLVFEFVGQSLHAVLTAAPEYLPLDTVRAWARAVLSGLAFMHARGFAHRDVKPENILVGRDGRAKLADLGLARSQESAEPATDYVATRWYRAPEVLLRAPGGARAPADVFAAGAVLAEALTLRPLMPVSAGRGRAGGERAPARECASVPLNISQTLSLDDVSRRALLRAGRRRTNCTLWRSCSAARAARGPRARASRPPRGLGCPRARRRRWRRTSPARQRTQWTSSPRCARGTPPSARPRRRRCSTPSWGASGGGAA
jgi:male germ cell-associated kinase